MTKDLAPHRSYCRHCIETSSPKLFGALSTSEHWLKAIGRSLTVACRIRTLCILGSTPKADLQPAFHWTLGLLPTDVLHDWPRGLRCSVDDTAGRYHAESILVSGIEGIHQVNEKMIKRKKSQGVNLSFHASTKDAFTPGIARKRKSHGNVARRTGWVEISAL